MDIPVSDKALQFLAKAIRKNWEMRTIGDGLRVETIYLGKRPNHLRIYSIEAEQMAREKREKKNAGKNEVSEVR